MFDDNLRSTRVSRFVADITSQVVSLTTLHLDCHIESFLNIWQNE